MPHLGHRSAFDAGHAAAAALRHVVAQPGDAFVNSARLERNLAADMKGLAGLGCQRFPNMHYVAKALQIRLAAGESHRRPTEPIRGAGGVLRTIVVALQQR